MELHCKESDETDEYFCEITQLLDYYIVKQGTLVSYIEDYLKSTIVLDNITLTPSIISNMLEIPIRYLGMSRGHITIDPKDMTVKDIILYNIHINKEKLFSVGYRSIKEIFKGWILVLPENKEVQYESENNSSSNRIWSNSNRYYNKKSSDGGSNIGRS